MGSSLRELIAKALREKKLVSVCHIDPSKEFLVQLRKGMNRAGLQEKAPTQVVLLEDEGILGKRYLAYVSLDGRAVPTNELQKISREGNAGIGVTIGAWLPLARELPYHTEVMADLVLNPLVQQDTIDGIPKSMDAYTA